MNNEKKAPVLTLEHLAPYLPYGVHAQSKNADFIITGATTEEVIGDNDLGEQTWDYEDVKLRLRPLSDLTKEIEHNGYRFIARNQIDQYTQVRADRKLYVLVDGAHWSCNPLEWDYQTVLWLIGLHFDVFGLIDKGLAIDINSIEGKETKGNG